MYGGGLLGLVFLFFWVWAIFDVITTPDGSQRNLPKLAWVLIVLFFFVLGALAWVALGRPHERPVTPGGGARPPRVRGRAAERWHPALDERVDNHETDRERKERERREYLRKMDEELDRRLEEKAREQSEGPDAGR